MASLQLNIGSGQRPFGKPWTNVDAQERWNPDLCARGEDLLTHYLPGSVSAICLHHVLEHFGCGEGDTLLKVCHELLQPVGMLLVFVPDLRRLAEMWIRGELDDQLYCTNLYGAYMGDEADRHRWGFTKQTLASTLLRAGFRFVRPFDWRAMPGADIARDDRWILALEARK